MNPAIHVLNASSRTDTGITEDLALSMGWLAGPGVPPIRCLTLEKGPKGISNSVDSARAAPAVLDHIKAHAEDESVAAFVVACFSDPGVHAARELTRKPVIGIGEAGLAVALTLGERLGTIGVSAGQSGKNRAFVRATGFAGRYAGHRSLGLDYADLQYPAKVSARLAEMAESLRREEDADVIVLAGAGLARYVDELRRNTGLPVVDPTLAAVSAALTATAWAGRGVWS